MKKLPVIVASGGMNAAGRISNHHAYKRMVYDVLKKEEMHSTWIDLAHRMGILESKPNFQSEPLITPKIVDDILNGTCVRKVDLFDPTQVSWHQKAQLDDAEATFELSPSKASSNLHTLKQSDTVLLPTDVELAVSSAGALPSGFDPGSLYKSIHHPRGLMLTIYGISDALHSMGLSWETVLSHIRPDEVAVFAGSALAQLDDATLKGVFGQPLRGERINSKMMALSLAEMPADFINSYVINNIGMTGHNVGACATFLYNLRQGVQAIQHGDARVVIVGASEAPLVPEVIDGFRVMGALATDKDLLEMDGGKAVQHHRACRPFSTNAGFTLAEGAQFIVLMDDTLAIELGAPIYGSVADVFIHADANKKSISSPGVGNYLTVAKAAALTNAILGDLSASYVQAHGTGTPQNRVTESHILNEVAKTFSCSGWPVAAVKSYIGHTVSAAAGDSLASALGVWQYGYIPGIKTIDHIADDVHQSHLNILMDHLWVGDSGQDISASVINSKGFGGNNASAVVLSPQKTQEILTKRYGQKKMSAYRKKHEPIRDQINQLDQQSVMGQEQVIYHFGTQVMDEKDIKMTPDSIQLAEFDQAVPLPKINPYLNPHDSNFDE